MKKKILLILGSLFVVIAGVIVISAGEAHIVNVTAHIENALKVSPLTGELEFGTVFPEQYKEKRIFITTSDSFCQPSQRDFLSIDYQIVQKAKCIGPTGDYKPVDWATHQCPVGYKEMPLLCPYLSKTPVYIDPLPYTDHGVLAFHNLAEIAIGTINKDHDLLDEWKIDLPVPCFNGYCSQDYDAFVKSYNPDADSRDFEAPGDPEGTNFGCDLWIETTKIY